MKSELLTTRRGFGFVTAGALLLFALAAQTALPGDFRKYSVAAELLASGDLATERLLDFSPLYLALSLLANKWTGNPGYWLELLNIALAAFAVGGLFVLMRRRFPLGIAGAAAVIFAFDRHLLVYQRILEPETVLLSLLIGVLLLLERAGNISTCAAGLLAAACLATRPTFAPIFILMPLYFRMHDRAENRASWLRRSGLFLAPVLMAIVALGFYSKLAAGTWRAPVMNPGTVFFEGNQPLSRGTSAIYPPLVLAMTRHSGERPDAAHEHYRETVRAAEPGATAAMVNSRWLGRAKHHLVDYPGQTARRLGTKLSYGLHGFRWHDVPVAWRLDRRLGWPSFPFSVLAACALIGLLTEARRWRAALPFYVLMATQTAVMLVFYVSARQRLVMLPALLYFAAAAVQAIRRQERRWPALALIGVLALALTLPDEAMHDEVHVQKSHQQTGPLISALTKTPTPLSERRTEVVTALASSPWWINGLRPAWVRQDDRTLDDLVADALVERLPEVPVFAEASARFDAAAALLRAGRFEEAVEWLQPLAETGFLAYRGSREPSDPRILLARAVAHESPEEAREWLHAALAANPADLFALADLAALDGDVWIEKLDRYVGEPDRRWLLGQAFRRFGQPERAVEQLKPLAASLPGLRDISLQLALALGDAGRFDEAAMAVLTANEIRSDPVVDVIAMAEIARGWAAAHPEDHETQLAAARLLHQHGFFTESATRIAKLLTRSNLPPELRQNALKEQERLHLSSGSKPPLTSDLD